MLQVVDKTPGGRLVESRLRRDARHPVNFFRKPNIFSEGRALRVRRARARVYTFFTGVAELVPPKLKEVVAGAGIEPATQGFSEGRAPRLQ